MLVVVGLAALLVVATLPLVLGKDRPRWDSDNFFMPAQMLVADHTRAGQLLLWNPWTNGGSPDGVDPQYGAFSPLNVGLGLLAGGSAHAFVLYWLVVWLLGGWGMARLARHLDMPGWGSFLAASSFMLSGFFVGHASNTGFVHAYAWLPWIVWRLDVGLSRWTSASRRASLLALAQAGALWGLSALGGYPGIVLTNAGLLALWTLGRQLAPTDGEGLAAPGRLSRAPRLATGALALTWLFLVGFVVLAPTWLGFLVEGRGVSHRVGALPREQAVTSNALDPVGLMSFASPHLPLHMLADDPPDWSTDVTSLGIHVAAVTLWLALAALVTGRRSFERWWWLAIGLLGLGLALGTTLPLRGWLYDLLPPARTFRHAAIFRGWYLFVIPLLAGRACQDLTRSLGRCRERVPIPEGRAWRACGVTLAALAVLAYGALVLSLDDTYDEGRPLADLHVGLAWVGVAAMAWLVAGPSARRVPAACLCLLVLDLVVGSLLTRPLMGTPVPRGRAAAWNVIREQRVDDLDLTRSSLARQPFPPFGKQHDNKNLPLKIPVFHGYQPIRNRIHAQWAHDEALRAAVVREDRIWFAGRDEVVEVPPDQAAFAAFRERRRELGAPPLVLHAREQMTLATGAADTAAATAAEDAARALAGLPAARPIGVDVLRYEPNHLDFHVAAPAPGWILVTDRWAPGWRAVVNDEPATVWGGDFLFRAVAVAAGDNVVRFTYRPFGFPWLLIPSWGLLLAVLAIPAVTRLVRRRGLPLAALLVALVPGCGPPAGSRPHVLLITLDTTRADHCSVLGYERETTPHLTRLGEQGTRFTRAYSPTSTTLPSHATLFTGTHPVVHRVVKNGLRLDENALTLAEQLGTTGWQTAGIVSSFVLDAKFGLSQGFDLWDDDRPAEQSTIHLDRWEGHRPEGGFDRRGDHTTDRALRWLEHERDTERPFFLFVHYFDPHFPLLPPPDLARGFGAVPGDESLETAKALYDAEIAFTDRQVGRLLEALDRLGLAEETLVVVTADHGEGLMDHGQMNHGMDVHEEAVHIPLVVRWPERIDAGRTIDEPVALVDLMPTLLELVGLDAQAGQQGESLAAVLTGSAALDPDRPVYLHRRFFEPRTIDGVAVSGEQFALRTGAWKNIEGTTDGTRQLFDLVRDPRERTNLVEEHPDVAARLAERLAAWLDDHRVEGERPLELDPEDAERLEAMGYVR